MRKVQILKKSISKTALRGIKAGMAAPSRRQQHVKQARRRCTRKGSATTQRQARLNLDTHHVKQNPNAAVPTKTFSDQRKIPQTPILGSSSIVCPFW